MRADGGAWQPRNSVGSQSGQLYDVAGRVRKAHKILAALRLVLPETKTLSLLDVGCASGVITNTLAPHFARAVGLDLDAAGLRRAEPNGSSTLLRGSSDRLPFASTSVDVVICAQVYEHVADQATLAAEIHRVLRPGGWCFFSGPNRLWPIEDHYKLPFLSWLPRAWAHAYLRALGRASTFDETLLTAGQLRTLFARFERIDVTARMIRDPQAFSLPLSVPLRLAQIVPQAFLRRIEFVYPNFNWLLRKPLAA